MLAMPNKPSNAGIGGIAHALIAVPKEDAHKVIVRGMHSNPSGRSGIITPMRPGTHLRHERFMDEMPQGMVSVEAFLHNAFVNIGLRGGAGFNLWRLGC